MTRALTCVVCCRIRWASALLCLASLVMWPMRELHAQVPPTLSVSPSSASVTQGGSQVFSVASTGAHTLQVQASPPMAGQGSYPLSGGFNLSLQFPQPGTVTLTFTATGAGGNAVRTVQVNVVPLGAAPSYPALGDFQWLSGGADVPAGDWNAPTISDTGVFVAAASDTFSGVALRFNRTAPSLSYQIIGAPCGSQTFCQAHRPRISGDARHVVFESRWDYDVNDLLPHSYVWVWDSQTGVSRRASVPNTGGWPNNDSFTADISRDGRYVSFLSTATNLTASATLGGTKAFRADMSTTPATVVHVSGPYNTVESARLSSSGQIVAFRADNQLLERDLLQPAPEFLGWLGSGSTMLGFEHSLSLSPDGRYAAQSILASGQVRTYVFDRLSSGVTSGSFVADSIGSVAASSGAGFVASAVCSFTNTYVAYVWINSRAGGGAYQGISAGTLESCDYGIDITPKGDLITVSLANLVVPNFAPPSTQQIYAVKNPLYQPLPANIAPYTGGIPANSTNVKSSADGKLAVFQSEIPAEQLLCFDAELQVPTPGCAPADGNGQPDVFRYDFDRNAVDLVSSPDGLTAVGGRNPDIDLSGEAIVFEAADGALAAKTLRDGKDYGARSGKGNTPAVFLARLLRNASQRTAQRLSVGTGGADPNGPSQNPSISPNGRYVSFSTHASNINPGGDNNGVTDVVRVEAATGTVACVSSCPGAEANQPSDHPSVSNAGLVALETRADALVKEYRGKGSSVFTQIVVVDPGRRTTRTLSRNAAGQPGEGPSGRPRISSAGTAVVYQSAAQITSDDANGRIDVYLANLIANTNQRISRKPPPGGKANAFAPKAVAGVEDGDSQLPTISGDGRFIAFQTTATNLVDTDANGVDDLVVVDARSGEMRRVSQGFGGVETDGASQTPHLNHNGTHLGFHSFATNLAELGDSDSTTSEPYVRDNPAAARVIFFDPFE